MEREALATIAVVDDDVAILDAVTLVLEEQGWTVRSYGMGEEFLAELKDARPDCVVLDSHLFGMSGAAVARALANENTAIPIVGLTAWPDSPLTDELTTTGVSVMLTKPVTAETLVGHIQTAIGVASSG